MQWAPSRGLAAGSVLHLVPGVLALSTENCPGLCRQLFLEVCPAFLQPTRFSVSALGRSACTLPLHL